MHSQVKLGKYKVIKVLGKGGFGNVYAVSDQNNNKFALKEIPKKDFSDDLDFIYQEVQIMKGLDSQYIVKFYSWEEDQDCVFIVMELCSGGDLRKQMSKLTSKYYSIHQAAEVMSDVIRGLEVVHSKKYIHRDIKIENILVGTNIHDRKTYKIADFGLSKNEERGTTILGTGHYMSPEIFEGVEYGYAVDMWAFGVLLFFLLNRSYPFQVNPFNDDLKEKWLYLCKQAKNFSYRKTVEKSKYKIMENCTEQTQDLFARIFQINQDKRITFAEIRRHPIFAPFFNDSMKEESTMMYTQKWKVKDMGDILTDIISQNALTKKKHGKDKAAENVHLRLSVIRPLEGSYPKEKAFVEHKNDEINFLYENFKEFKQATGILTLIEKAPLCYNLVKYYLNLKHHFLLDLRNPDFIKKNGLLEYSKTEDFRKLYKEIEDQMQGVKYQFQILQSQCSDHLDEIETRIQTFKQTFQDSWKTFDFQASKFKRTYRKSTLYTFNKLKRFLKEKVTGNKYNYFLSLSVISHVFNRLFKEKQHFSQVFKQYFELSGTNSDSVDYSKLREWMTKASGQELNGVTKKIIKLYFQD